MKLPKLKIHQPNFSSEELVINPKDFPDIRIDDVIELYHEEQAYSRLLLQVRKVDDSIQQNTVSVLDSIATGFHLKSFHEVHVNKVLPKDVSLDLVEVVFKEQYLSRSDMWRLRKSLLNSVVYVNKTVRFADIRATVDELYSRGDRVACGYITNDTRFTFRSGTAQVNIFIQLSCEMWDFDNYGDLYFEKAVQGYLVDLFKKWQDKNCNHDVTIVLFSRTFYDAKLIDEFPKYMRECVRTDYKGRFYEDFYRVVVQNERYDDWTKTILTLKRLFSQYNEDVLKYHERPGYRVPPGRNSTAAEGNFLEVLNMGLNIYEKYYLDRNFDRTGKLSLVITPGPGVFDVDRDLTFITKQRTIDCGNSCDLVCMGEQPFHVVPLLKFHNNNPIPSTDVGDDYNIPHWINHSFYMSENQEAYMRTKCFLPRIRAPVLVNGATHSDRKQRHLSGLSVPMSSYLENDDVPIVDYDAYDNEVFNLYADKPRDSSGDTAGLRRAQTTGCRESMVQSRANVFSVRDLNTNELTNGHSASISGGTTCSGARRMRQRLQYTSSMRKELLPVAQTTEMAQTGSASDFLPFSFEDTSSRGFLAAATTSRNVVGSCCSPVDRRSLHSLHNYRPARALINPFTPSRLHFKVTSNRRRWAHAFPKDTQGATVQPHRQHLYSATSTGQLERHSPRSRTVQTIRTALEMRRTQSGGKATSESSDYEDVLLPSSPPCSRVSVTVSSSSDSGNEGGGRENQVTFQYGIKKTSSYAHMSPLEGGINSDKDISCFGSAPGRRWPFSRSLSIHRDVIMWEEGHNWMFGITGEQEWTPEVQTGMDWKSMMRPASQPITTDYFPDRRSLEDSYQEHPYTIVSASFFSNDYKRRPLSIKEVYNELVYQRIAQGFQIVLRDKTHLTEPTTIQTTTTGLLGRSPMTFHEEAVTLSIGRIFHQLKLCGDEITVKLIAPKHPYPQKKYHYTYRFQMPDSQAYDVSWTEFGNEKLEDYKWNYVDQHICHRGENDDFLLQESMKYWRAQFFLLPANNAGTKKIQDGSPRCDVYEDREEGEERQLTDGFFRFMVAINKIRRPPNTQRANKPRPGETAKRRVSIPVSPTNTASQASSTATAPSMGVRSVSDKIAGVSSATGVGGATGSGAAMKQGVSGHPHHYTTQQDFADSLHVGSMGSQTLSHLVHRDSALPVLGGSEVKGHLQRDASYVEIVVAMLDPNDGLLFLNDLEEKLAQLPPNSFLAREAVLWLYRKVEGVDCEQAMEIMQALLKEGYICHGSGDVRHKQFRNGFVIYTMLYDKDKKEIGPRLPNNFSFEFEWCEVVMHSTPSANWQQPQPPFVWPHLETRRPSTNQLEEHRRGKNVLDSSPLECAEMRNAYVDIDAGGHSDRSEWGTARVHAHYHPSAAFQLELQWLVATGCILGDLVSGWAWKAAQNGFHFLPVPGDPFALPFTPNSDPLRGPIFVPLQVGCLLTSPTDEHPFTDFPEETRAERMMLFQHCILKRFGFMADHFHPNHFFPSLSDPAPPSYIHCSGGMFVMIPDAQTKNRTTAGYLSKTPTAMHCGKGLLAGKHASSLGYKSPNNHSNRLSQSLSKIDQSKSMQMNGLDQSDDQTHEAMETFSENSYRYGFLWSWNFLLTRKWRSSHTGDEHYQDKMLADFRAFCSNAENRLRDFYDESRALFIKVREDIDFDCELRDVFN